MSQVADDLAARHGHGLGHEHGHVIGSQSHIVSNNQSQPLHDSSNGSQATNSTNATDRVFTPPESDSEGSARHGNGNGTSSSQESQLMQLSNLAALQEKIAVSQEDADVMGTQSKKRMADGVVKHRRNQSTASTKRMGHSRNTSTVSVASTTSSRIGELSAELKTKLSYAMVKVNNGWQSHTIDEVESLASQAASPTSSSSTIHGRHGLSASPRIALASVRQGSAAQSGVAASPSVHQSQPRTYESFWRESASKMPGTTSPVAQVPTLAPPAPIQPRQSAPTHPRRNSNARYTPAYLSHQTSPHTPLQPSPLQNTPGQHYPRAPSVDPILFSPPQNVREQEALETLMFMSSPKNSDSLNHAFPTLQPPQPRHSARTPLVGLRPGPTGDVASHGRRALPTGRPSTQQPKRVEFGKSHSTLSSMGVEDQYASPQARAMPRRRTLNGAVSRPFIPLSTGLDFPPRTKPPLGDDDVQRMISQAAAAESSDSEGEIRLPRTSQRNSTGVGV